MFSMELTVTNSNDISTALTLTETSLDVQLGTSAPPTQRSSRFSLRSKTGSTTQIPIRNVVSATFSVDSVGVSYVSRKCPKSRFSLDHISGSLSEDDAQRAKQWCDAVMAAAYQGRSPPKKLKILVNPHGGPVCS